MSGKTPNAHPINKTASQFIQQLSYELFERLPNLQSFPCLLFTMVKGNHFTQHNFRGNKDLRNFFLENTFIRR